MFGSLDAPLAHGVCVMVNDDQFEAFLDVFSDLILAIPLGFFVWAAIIICIVSTVFCLNVTIGDYLVGRRIRKERAEKKALEAAEQSDAERPKLDVYA